MILQNIRQLTLSISLLGLMSACHQSGVVPDSGSELDQISRQRYKCDYHPVADADAILADAPDGFFVGWTDPQEFDLVKQSMANLPDEYLNHLYEANSQAGFSVRRENLGAGIGGLTMLGYYSAWAKVAPGAVEWALLHEIGHAMQYYIDNKSKGALDRDIAAARQQEMGQRNVGSYATTTQVEWFAEAFQSYYCGRSSQTFIQEELPLTWDFFDENVAPARWEKNFENNNVFKLYAHRKGVTNGLQDSVKFYVAGPSNLESVTVCPSIMDRCMTQESIQTQFRFKQKLANGVHVFESDKLFPLKKLKSVSVFAYYDENGQKFQYTDEIKVEKKAGIN